MTYTYYMSEIDATETGTDMIFCAAREWSRYDDFDAFLLIEREDGKFYFSDGEMGKSLTIDPADFFEAHKALIFEAEILQHNVSARYFMWACKVTDGATPDDYDDWTCDLVLQILLYGEVIYS